MHSDIAIVRIPILPLRMINAHLILGPEGGILVDAGVEGSEDAIGRVLRRHGLGFQDIRLIVITHAHGDHAGGAARAKARSDAPILAHRAERPYLQGTAPMTFCATRSIGRLMLAAKVPQRPYPPCVADIEMSDAAFDLEPYGTVGQVLPTTGHTPGSISVLLPSGDALVGDLLASGVGLGGIMRLGRAFRPVFEEDAASVAHRLQSLLDAGARHFHLGHGGPLPAPEVQRHVEALRALDDASTPALAR